MIFAIRVISVNSLSVFNCSQTLCTSTMIGNGKCDFVCNTGICNFDSNDTVNSNLLVRFSYSDCYGSCISTGCNLAHLANGICDSDCNSASCGWDLADCGNCSSGCYIANLTDSSISLKLLDLAMFHPACMIIMLVDDVIMDAFKKI